MLVKSNKFVLLFYVENLSEEENVPEILAETNTPQKPIFTWLKRFLFLIIIVVIIYELYRVWPYIWQSKNEVLHANWWWLGASVIFALLAMHSFAQVQRKLFNATGYPIKQKDSEMIMYAANAISISLPGGQVLAPAFIYNRTKKLGIPTVIASWQIVMSGVMMTIGLAVLGFGGIIFAGASENPFTILMSVLVCGLIFALAQFLATHPDVLKSIGVWGIRLVTKVLKKNPEPTIKSWSELVDQINSVKLSKKSLVIAFTWSVINWMSDVLCLLAACYATGSRPTLLTVIIAYSSSRFLVAIVPWIPAGIGALDVTITSALVAGGMNKVTAAVAVIIYRLTRYLLIAIIGWIIYLVRFRKTEPLGKKARTLPVK